MKRIIVKGHGFREEKASQVRKWWCECGDYPPDHIRTGERAREWHRTHKLGTAADLSVLDRVRAMPTATPAQERLRARIREHASTHGHDDPLPHHEAEAILRAG